MDAKLPVDPVPESSGAGEQRPGILGLPLGVYGTNCYIVTPTANPAPGDPCWIVDTGFEPFELIEAVRRAKLRPEAVVLTHAHADHIAGLNEVTEAFPGVPVLLHEAEAGWLADPGLNLSAFLGEPVVTRPADRTLSGGETLTLAGQAWEVRHTPGHSPGGITLYHAPSGTALVGDTLFAGSIGRTDFPTSNHAALAQSIRAQIYTLPSETKVYPGHGPTTTVGRERISNPFVRA